MWFFRWLANAVNKAIEWVVSIPGMIATFIATLTTTITGAFTFFSSHSQEINQVVSSAQTQVQSVNSFLSCNSVFNTLSYMAAFDIAWAYISSIGGLFLGIFGFLFIELVEGIFLLAVALFVFKTVRWICTLITLGVSQF